MDTVKRMCDLASEHGMSVYRLTQLSGISHSTIQTARRRGGQLSVDTIERICQALDMPLYSFFMDAGAEANS